MFLGVTASIGISNGHLNPAVSVALAITESGFEKLLLPIYLCGQYLVPKVRTF